MDMETVIRVFKVLMLFSIQCLIVGVLNAAIVPPIASAPTPWNGLFIGLLGISDIAGTITGLVGIIKWVSKQ